MIELGFKISYECKLVKLLVSYSIPIRKILEFDSKLIESNSSSNSFLSRVRVSQYSTQNARELN